MAAQLSPIKTSYMLKRIPAWHLFMAGGHIMGQCPVTASYRMSTLRWCSQPLTASKLLLTPAAMQPPNFGNSRKNPSGIIHISYITMYAPKSPNSPFFDCWGSGSPDNPQIQGSISPCISWNSTKSISTSFSHIKLHSTLTSHDFPIILPFCLSQNHGFPLRFSHPFPVQAPHLPPLCCRRWCWNCPGPSLRDPSRRCSRRTWQIHGEIPGEIHVFFRVFEEGKYGKMIGEQLI